MKQLFITGTDTGVGKTFIARTLLDYIKCRDTSSIGFKPIASGCEETPEGLRNEDALALHAESTIQLDYNEVNPYAFKEAIAPHLAAQLAGQSLSVAAITDAYLSLKLKEPDLLLVEGAGGWRLPLGNGEFMSDFVQQQAMPVLLVVGMRLGCLNHARLTAEAIERDGLHIAGWVANQIDHDMPYKEENVATLKELIDAPYLGHLPLVSKPSEAWPYLDFTPLFRVE
ncbi:dethiobiotin synthase [Paraneptunicella aestuarii]|uniref:dethiobiotin synthase n=1 Tax=Paraneptunicella aestuarii TaxID=2831148 RepID=UPI001E6415C0|nr:dethiobiotin synthase [Paraneptunicella aestuarii]UAA40458.1 dethiobiotin synthase [Paraneptunicella aestuarii]